MQYSLPLSSYKMDNSTKYRAFTLSKLCPLFLQPWWYDATCGQGGWQVALARDQDGRITAAWPFRYRTQWGIGRISLPPMTPWSGIVSGIHWPADTFERKINSHYRKTMETLIQQLPPHLLLHQTFLGPAPHPLPLHWAGYRERSSWTYLLPDLSSETKLWAGFRHNTRKNIAKGMRNCLVDTTMDPQEFQHFHAQVWRSKSQHPDLDPAVWPGLTQAILEHGCGRIYRSRDNKGQTHAALFLLWDHERANVWLSASDPAHYGTGAMYALYWAAIRDHIGSGKCFDFEGGMLQGPETTYAAFGAERRPLHTYTFIKNRLWATWSLWTGREYL
jgi:hypothetical protein